jgi:hypothetical protein
MNGPIHDDPDPADLAEGARQGELLCDLIEQARAQGVCKFDQFLAHLRDLVLPIDRVAGTMLPAGLRIELIEVLAIMMRTVIYTMDDEDPAPDRKNVHTETIELVTSVLRYAEEKRFQNRVLTVAADLDEDWEVYDHITQDDDLLAAFAEEAGQDASDATIRAWLVKTASKTTRQARRRA